jgi:hypothetical protein
MRSTRKSQRLRDKIAYLVTKTERKIEGTSKVKKKLTKKKVAKNDHGITTDVTHKLFCS